MPQRYNYKSAQHEVEPITKINLNSDSRFKLIFVYIYIYIYVCVCVCVCVDSLKIDWWACVDNLEI